MNEYLICSGYKSAMIEEHFYNIKSIKTEIVNSGRVDILQESKIVKMLDNEFMVCYGDTIADVNINKL